MGVYTLQCRWSEVALSVTTTTTNFFGSLFAWWGNPTAVRDPYTHHKDISLHIISGEPFFVRGIEHIRTA